MEQVSTFIPRIYLPQNRNCIRRYAIHAMHWSGYLQRLVAKEEKEIESSREFYISSLSAFPSSALRTSRHQYSLATSIQVINKFPFIISFKNMMSGYKILLLRH
jgi:hypothetical protein